jgi:hypothetical protein
VVVLLVFVEGEVFVGRGERKKGGDELEEAGD